MKPQPTDDIAILTELLRAVLQRKDVPAELADYTASYPDLGKLVQDLLALREFTHALSNGDLSKTLEMRGHWAGLFNALQANLRHLAWQTAMVAAGDYTQRVDFMGDFSAAFNTMTDRLAEAAEAERNYIAALAASHTDIRESERRYKLIAENTEDVIWMLDTDLTVSYISPSVEKLIGCPACECEGKPLSHTPLAALRPFIETKTAERQNRGKPFTVEVEMPHKQKTMVWTESSITAARGEAGNFIGLLGVTRGIDERKRAQHLLYHTYERKRKRDFFLNLASGIYDSDAAIQDAARRNEIFIPHNFSLFFLYIENIDQVVSGHENSQFRKQQIIDALVDHLSREGHTVAWETDRGLGIINTASAPVNRKNYETKVADAYLRYVSLYMPCLQAFIGIANYQPGWANFAGRFNNAETAVTIGRRVWPHLKAYHYEDCGIYQVLAPFALTDEAAAYVARTIGPLIEHDRKDGTNLVETLERILSGQSLKEIAAQLYLHHKTVQLRKHRIEKILNISLDSYETRTALATALQLRKIFNRDT